MKFMNKYFCEFGIDDKLLLKFQSFFFRYKEILGYKNVILSNICFNSSASFAVLTIFCFFKTSKVLKFKSKWKRKKYTSKVAKKNKLEISNLFFKQFQKLKYPFVVLTLKNLNKSVNPHLTKVFFSKFRREKTFFFSRQNYLFWDFSYILALFIEQKISSFTFLFFLGQIFKTLQKKKHNRFFLFIKKLFLFILDCSKNLSNKKKTIEALKLDINGKIGGNLRASSKTISLGPLSENTFDIDFCSDNLGVFTLYGMFGFKLCVCST